MDAKNETTNNVDLTEFDFASIPYLPLIPTVAVPPIESLEEELPKWTPPELTADEMADSDAEIKNRKPRLVSHSLADLAEMDLAIDYLIEGVLVEKQNMVIGGAKKTLKSSVAISMMTSITTGAPFLDCYPVLKRKRALVFSAESGLATLKDKIRANHEAFGMDYRLNSNLFISSDLPKLGAGQKAYLKALYEQMVITGAEVVVIDPLYLALPSGNESSINAFGEAVADISRLCERMGWTLIFVHHTRKTVYHYEPFELGDLSGAGVDAWARSWCLINHRGKHQHGSGWFKLWASIGGSAGHGHTVAMDIFEGVYDSSSKSWRQWEVKLAREADARDFKKAEKKQEKLLSDNGDREEIDALKLQALRAISDDEGPRSWSALSKLPGMPEKSTKKFAKLKLSLTGQRYVDVTELKRGERIEITDAGHAELARMEGE